MVRGTFSPARASRHAAVVHLAPTLGVTHQPSEPRQPVKTLSLSRHERVAGAVCKVCACSLFLLAVVGNAYFTLDGFTSQPIELSLGAIFTLTFGLAISGAGLLFLYGAAKASVGDYAMQLRLLRRYGFLKLKNIGDGEYERLSKLEASIDKEIRGQRQDKEPL